MRDSQRTLVLRLSGPLQSWGIDSQYNRRNTFREPTKSGVVGLLAAAQGRHRGDPIEDLVGLTMAVRTDEPGSVLRDYHTVSNLHGTQLLSAATNTKGHQVPSKGKWTAVTQRMYLQDATFVVGVSGDTDLLVELAARIVRPAFPLALGRRACVPTQPLILTPCPAEVPPSALWSGDPMTVLASVPWQLSLHRRRTLADRYPGGRVDLPVTIDTAEGGDALIDMPRSFDPRKRAMTARSVRYAWVRVEIPSVDAGGELSAGSDAVEVPHDPFAFLGW